MLSNSTMAQIMACKVFRAQSRNDLSINLSATLKDAKTGVLP